MEESKSIKSTELTSLLERFGEWPARVLQWDKLTESEWNLSLAEGKWTVRECVAHIALRDDYFWEEAISRVAGGLPLTARYLFPDELKDRASRYGRSASRSELVAHAVRSRRRILDAVAAMTEEQAAGSFPDGYGYPFEIMRVIQDAIQHDRRHIAQIGHAVQLRLEQISLNGWPALQTLAYDGWLLRFSEGYTKRSNSVQPIYESRMDALDKIRHCEKLYRSQGIKTVFKITPPPHPADLDDTLDKLGYAIIDRTSLKTALLADMAEPAFGELRTADKLTDEWLSVYCGISPLGEGHRRTAAKLLEAAPLAKCFAVLYAGGTPVACGLGVLESNYIGLYDIVTGERYRNKGYGEQLIRHILQWGKENGAEAAYLLVVNANASANRLYDKLGFARQYEYWYRISPDA